MSVSNSQIILTEEIRDILNAVSAGAPAIKIAAFAGTGKTTTLLEIAKRTIGRKLYLVFNEGVQKEAKEKFKNTNTTVLTTHSMAYQNVVKAFGYTIKEIKAREIATLYSITYEKARNVLNIFNNFCNSHSLEWRSIDEIGEGVLLAEKLFNDMVSKEIPVSHSFYLKVFQMLLLGKQLDISQFDIVLLDEAQDTNDVTLSIFFALNAKQKILVGDRHQQIYSFRGSINAMNKVKASVFPLTKSFRFGNSTARKASYFLSLFKGEKLSLLGTESQSNSCITHATITRTNGEMIKYIKNFIDNKKKFKTIRKPWLIFGLPINLLKLSQGKSLDRDFAYLYAFLKDYKRERRVSYISDPNDFFNYMEQSCKEDTEIISALKAAKIEGLENLYSESVNNFEGNDDCYEFLTTAHTSKGLEWDSITISSDFNIIKNIGKYFSDKNIKNDTVLNNSKGYLDYFVKNCNEQRYLDELNLYYVALTRAKKNINDKAFLNLLELSVKDIDTLIKKNI